MPDPLQAIAEAVREGADAARLRVLRITEVGADGRVRTDGTGAGWSRVDDSLAPQVGDRVYAVEQGGTRVVVGRLAGARAASGPPVGSVTPYAGTTAPTGWLLCEGQALLRADYPDLFAALGTAYGAPDSTRFRVPDLRGRLPVGSGSYPRASTGGAATVTLSTAMTPDHSHGASQTSHSHGSSGDHQHSTAMSNVTAASGTAVTAKGGGTGAALTTVAGGGGHTHTGVAPAVTVSGTGAPTADVPTMPPYVAMPYIIRAV